MKKFFKIVFVCFICGLHSMGHELADQPHTHGDTPAEIIDYLVNTDEFKKVQREALESLDVNSLDLFRQKLEKANTSFEAGRLINMSAKKLSQFKNELDDGYVQSFVELLLRKSKEFPEGLHGHYLAIESLDSGAAALLLPEMLKSEDPFIRMVAEKKVAAKRQPPNRPASLNRVEIEKSNSSSVLKKNVKSKELIQPTEEEYGTEKKSSLPWIIAGVLLLGILFLLFKTFKGKSTS